MCRRGFRTVCFVANAQPSRDRSRRERAGRVITCPIMHEGTVAVAKPAVLSPPGTDLGTFAIRGIVRRFPLSPRWY